MSSQQETGAGRFIPTLTEVIDETPTKNALPSHPNASNLERITTHEKTQLKPTFELAKKRAQQGSQNIHSLGSFYKVGTQPPSSQNNDDGQVHISMDSAAPPHAQQSSYETYDVRIKGKEANPTTQNTATHWDSLEIPEVDLDENDIFSPLACNPASTQDTFRPSDLMLVALSERIAAKARIRIDQNLEKHIQTKIFPLLDDFAEQLVSLLQGDMLKIMREGLAEATREELERLGQRKK